VIQYTPMDLARDRLELLLALSASDLRARYGRGRLRGLKWILDPFAAVGVYLLLSTFVLNRPGRSPGLSIACAVVPFQLVMMTVINALRAVETRSAIICNRAFDKRLLPVASAIVEAVGFGAALLLLALMMVIYGVAPTWAILMLPVVIAVTIIFSIAMAFPAALIGVWLPDVQPFVVSAVRALYFGAPGIVALDQIHGRAHDLLRINPLTGLFEAFRDVVMRGAVPAAWELAYPLAFGVAILALTRPIWRMEEPHFVKVVG
jgi:lipopolysaccharide transport system permease protein